MQRLRVAGICGAALGLLLARPAAGEHCTEPGCDGPDVDHNCAVDVSDLGVLLANFGLADAGPEDGDVDGNGTVDVSDLGLVLAVFGQTCGEVVDPNEPDDATANLTAYRPQHGAGYEPFARTAVAEADEQDAELGPGIRVHGGGEADPVGEDDLIEVRVAIDPADVPFALRRGAAALRVWTTRDRQAGSEIAFVGDLTGALPFAAGQTELTLWVEWADPEHGVGDLQIERLDNGAVKDALTFHTFRSVVIALGGEGQPPGKPVDANMGTFVVAVALYAQGYDVHMYDEDVVAANGLGAAYDEVVNAIQNRAVSDVAIFGYSHGGGSTYHLSERLDLDRAGIGLFAIPFTSYVDSVRNNSDIDTAQELRRPPSVGWHENHYQVGTLADFFLDGGPVPDSNPPPTGLNVETTPWGAGATHFEVDDFAEVRGAIETDLKASVPR